MNNAVLLAITAGAALVVGAGGTWLVISHPTVEARTVPKAELTAAIAADPSLCPLPVVEKPSEGEALAAYQNAQSSSPLVWDRNDTPKISLALGQCDKNNNGPGVACMTTVKISPEAQPLNRVVGFARAANGEWVATIF
ncbi:hypothetical protein EN836_23760 [Mesorhizobium sp. M1C.F.Ca.ET.193.01.1.1]|uniref:hypothetical protein n=1 Tax=unclassified Mesorhizobium TaxID=325217 RepID=UPI000FD1D749|nr:MULTISPECIES: hypothetical protein [unclassified Mesorhizobium]TGS94410.1 hypothetical protein EN820_46100 [bacterium M00.F.Ca.ET.177.01.1.1]RWB51852.1 MAG: hypothetical protein EOQ47_28350 [Mesorhizobium sp.]TGQ51585.1 hypothetical protein EN853_23750 [Mesorhizobium sp. M1C.F.Ca.ET.210.01.1.1]TGQ67813.1 hypothetical protein EN855_023760 [Mesorhizobium sp. M1C.F.Ca.ET.212.01.1.1]TGR02407.1 hypothetical protein EN847_23750 [Mesorhizobium sp. M1C.F.Ca.ET.204.01.1.1]